MGQVSVKDGFFEGVEHTVMFLHLCVNMITTIFEMLNVFLQSVNHPIHLLLAVLVTLHYLLEVSVLQSFLSSPERRGTCVQFMISFKLISDLQQGFFNIPQVFQENILNSNLISLLVLVFVAIVRHFLESGHNLVKSIE